MNQTIRRKLKIKSRPFTLIEVMVVVALIAVMAGFGTWSLIDLLAHHRREAEVDELKNFLQELQIEALALQSDLEVSFYRDKETLIVKSKTAEKILRDRKIELKEVNQFTVDDREEKRKTFQILSTGRFHPQALIGIERNQSSVWVDLRQPIQIKYSKQNPGRHVVILPQKPKFKEF